MKRSSIHGGAAGVLALGLALPLAAGPGLALFQDPSGQDASGAADADAGQSSDQPSGERNGGLIKVEPFGAGAGPDERGATQLGLFDGEVWRERLTDFDLGRREAYFDRIVDQARMDAGAEAWLRERAADTSEPELAWTARLALREAERSRTRRPFGAFDLFGPGGDPFEALGLDEAFGGLGFRQLPMDAEAFQKRIEDMMRRMQSGGAQPGAPGGTSHQRSLRLEQDSSGGARLRVTEIVDGVEQTEEYTGDTLEDILAEHPELRDELGLDAGGAFGTGLDLRLGPPRLPGLEKRLPETVPDASEPDASRAGQPVDTRYLGVFVTEVTDEVRERLGLDEGTGVIVQRTLPGSYAHLMGISAGNVIVELNGTEVRGLETIGEVMNAREPNESIDVVLYDNWDQVRERTWRP